MRIVKISDMTDEQKQKWQQELERSERERQAREQRQAEVNSKRRAYNSKGSTNKQSNREIYNLPQKTNTVQNYNLPTREQYTSNNMQANNYNLPISEDFKKKLNNTPPTRQQYTPVNSTKVNNYNLPIAEEFKKQLENNKRVESQNAINLTLPEAVNIGTDIISSIQAGKMNTDLAKNKFISVSDKNMRNNFYGGIANTTAGIYGAVAVPIGESIKKTGKLLNNEKLQKWGNTWQDSAKVFQDVSNYSSKVNSQIKNDIIKITGRVSSTIGGMVPSIALSLATGGRRSSATRSWRWW